MTPARTEPAGRRLETRLTQALGIEYPILSAPMAFAGGGKLAAAVSRAGGLGLIGGGYADPAFLADAFRDAGNADVGCGFITWYLEGREAVLHEALARRPRLIMLSFGDPRPYAEAIAAAGVPLVCQIQFVGDVDAALDAGAQIIVAQGAEAGGHGASRATMTLVPEVRDRVGDQALVVAAGGIADGRGLAAALALGADGVLMGSRFWAAAEALTHPRHQAAAVEASGDGTVRQRATDIARGYDWPEPFTARVLDNRFVREWEHRPDEHRAVAEHNRAGYTEAFKGGDPDNTGVFVGEAAGLIRSVEPAEQIVEQVVDEALGIMRRLGTAADGAPMHRP